MVTRKGGIDNKGSFGETKIGLDIDTKVTNRVSLASQLFALRREHNLDSQIDWGNSLIL